MFSKELEDLINYSLLDGEIDKKEKKVIYKKAEEEGVDFDELEIYLNSKIYGQLSKDEILRDETSSSTQKKVRTKKSNSRKVNRHKKPKRRISFGVKDFVPAITSTILAIIVFFYYDNLFISILLSSLTFNTRTLKHVIMREKPKCSSQGYLSKVRLKALKKLSISCVSSNPEI